MKMNTRILILLLILFGIGIIILIALQSKKSITPANSSLPTTSSSGSRYQTPSGFGARIDTQTTTNLLPSSGIQIVSATPSGQILPYDSLYITFAGNPMKNQCQVTTLLFEPSQYQVNMDATTLIISPTSVWPVATEITFTLTCTRLKQVVSYQVRDQSSLSPNQRFQTETHSAKQTGQSRRAYLTSHSYVQSFPINRSSYFILFIEGGNYMYVVSTDGTPFSDDMKIQISTKERPQVTKLGVPTSVPFVFQGAQ